MRPPRLAEWIAARTVPARERVCVLGDLQEDFETIALTQSPRAARRWYWAQVIRSAPRNLLRAGRRDPALPLAPTRARVLNGVGLDLRYAARALRKEPVFALVAVLSLGFGIGAATTLFSVVDAVDLRQLPYANAERLVFLAEITPLSDKECPGCPALVTAATAEAWRTSSRSFEAFGVMDDTGICLEEAGAIACPDVGQASPGFFDVLGVRPVLGRLLSPADALSGAAPVVILSYETWVRRYHSNPAVIGERFEHYDDSTLAVRRLPAIVGVLPPDFRFLREYPIWLPLDATATPRRFGTLTAIARLRPQLRRVAVEAELQSLRSGLASAGGAERRDVAVLPLAERLGWRVGKGRGILFGIALIVLAVAVLNVGALFAIRAAARRHELTMRRALGASRPQIVRHLLAEGLVIGLCGGVLGVAFAVWGTGVASASFALDRYGPMVQMDVRVASFALLLSVLAGVLLALLAARGVGKIDPAAIRDRAPSGAGRTGRRLADALLGVQIAAALLLVTVAGLLSSEYMKLRFFDIGYDPADVYEAGLAGPAAYRAAPELLRIDAERAVARLRTVPGIESASLDYRSAVNPAFVRADSSATPDESIAVEAVDASYFTTLGIPVVGGRPLSELDRRGAAPVAVVNRAAAARLWPGQSALGHRIFFGDSASSGEWATVVGIVADVERGEMVRRHHPRVYRPLTQARIYHPFIQVHFRAAAGHPEVARTAQAALRDAFGRPVPAVTSHEAELNDEFVSQRINALALNLFAGFALLLSAMGVYGSVAYAVAQRSREVGLRVALGASRRAVLMLFARQAAIIAGAGIAFGFGGSLLITRAFQSLVSAVDATDPRVFAGATLLVLLALLIATLLPARRAMGVDPAIALRGE